HFIPCPGAVAYFDSLLALSGDRGRLIPASGLMERSGISIMASAPSSISGTVLAESDRARTSASSGTPATGIGRPVTRSKLVKVEEVRDADGAAAPVRNNGA